MSEDKYVSLTPKGKAWGDMLSAELKTWELTFDKVLEMQRKDSQEFRKKYPKLYELVCLRIPK